MSKGITLLAIGKQVFGQFAFNMAVSLKYHNPNLKIQLVHDGQATKDYTDWHWGEFDIHTPIAKDDYTTYFERNKIPTSRMSPALAKLNLYSYYAFDETIYLDVDGFAIRDIQPIFDAADQYYHAQTSSTHMWADIQKVKDHFGLNGNKFPTINSSLQYIKKGKEAKALYDKALEFFNKPIPMKEQQTQWYFGQPDELYMNAALCDAKLTPKIKGIDPMFCRWKSENGAAPTFGQIQNGHYIIGLWGHPNNIHRSIREYYDSEMRRYFKGRWGSHHFFKIHQLLKRKI